MTEDVEPEALHAEEALGSARAPRALLAPANVDQNLRDAAQVWAVMVGCWLGILFGPAALYPLWVLILGGRLNALGVILHELCHMPPQRGGPQGDAEPAAEHHRPHPHSVFEVLLKARRGQERLGRTSAPLRIGLGQGAL